MRKPRLRILRRAPRLGESGWWVFPHWTMAQIRSDIIKGADISAKNGKPLLGWVANGREKFMDDDGLQAVTITVAP